MSQTPAAFPRRPVLPWAAQTPATPTPATLDDAAEVARSIQPVLPRTRPSDLEQAALRALFWAVSVMDASYRLPVGALTRMPLESVVERLHEDIAVRAAKAGLTLVGPVSVTYACHRGFGEGDWVRCDGVDGLDYSDIVEVVVSIPARRYVTVEP